MNLALKKACFQRHSIKNPLKLLNYIAGILLTMNHKKNIFFMD
jgi:hypothetical protein